MARDSSHRSLLSRRQGGSKPAHALGTTGVARTKVPLKRNDAEPIRPWEEPVTSCRWPNRKARIAWEVRAKKERKKAAEQKKRDGRRYHPVREVEEWEE